jgi:hypothetical protein
VTDAASSAFADLGELDVLAATLRAFGAAIGAQRIQVVIDRGDEHEPALIECMPHAPIALVSGEEAVVLADEGGAEPLPLPHVHDFGVLDVDAAKAEITAPIGAVHDLAAGVRSFAELFEGRTVVAVEFPSSDPEAPVTIAARTGEPLVLAIGDEEFEMPAGWPS